MQMTSVDYSPIRQILPKLQGSSEQGPAKLLSGQYDRNRGNPSLFFYHLVLNFTSLACASSVNRAGKT